jgi:hypothetical protein
LKIQQEACKVPTNRAVPKHFEESFPLPAFSPAAIHFSMRGKMQSETHLLTLI